MIDLKKNEVEKVKLYSYTDLDGYGCNILAKLVFGGNVDITNVNYDKIDEEVSEFIKVGTYQDYDIVFITDISVSQEVAGMIDDVDGTGVRQTKFVLLDHHETAKWLNIYTWANVKVKNTKGLCSGTSLFFEYLKSEGYISSEERCFSALQILVEKIRRYDTWEWKDVYNDEIPAKLNNLMYIIGTDEFVQSMLDKLRLTNIDWYSYSEGNWHQMFSDVEKAIIEIDEKKKEDYIKSKNKQLVKFKFLKHDIGVVFAEQHISELGNELSELNPDLEYIAIINMGNKSVSLRTTKDTIHLGQDIASIFGGGGHAKASGFSFNKKVLNSTIKMIFGLGFLNKLSKFIDKIIKK